MGMASGDVTRGKASMAEGSDFECLSLSEDISTSEILSNDSDHEVNSSCMSSDEASDTEVEPYLFEPCESSSSNSSSSSEDSSSSNSSEERLSNLTWYATANSLRFITVIGVPVDTVK